MNDSRSAVAGLPMLSRELVSAPGFSTLGPAGAPEPQLLELPEKAVQFGTGAFLRGFVEFFLDAANRQGRFGGRVVMIGSTGSGRDRILGEQDGLYTLATRGLQDGEPREEHRVIGAVSRALAASREWDRVLELARSPALELVFSNTTEVGIALDEGDDPSLAPPRSFPGKLTRFLLERGRAFDFDPGRGLVVLPCELVENNGDRLREIVLALAERWGLEAEFGAWLREAVAFCTTLVDRIVPGTPEADEADRLQQRLGYRDGLLTVAEPYRLFAIQGDGALRARLGFADADPGILVTEDIAPYRERKVRLLNGSHTLMAPLALLCGCETVADAMQHPLVGAYVRTVILEEIAPSLDAPGAADFARAVLDRFANPFLRHALFDITLQGATKLRVRVVPSLVDATRKTGRVPDAITFGFAAYLLFMRGELHEARRAAGQPVPEDTAGERIRALWHGVDPTDPRRLAGLVDAVCADEPLWGSPLTEVPGFAEAATEHLHRICRAGVEAALRAHLAVAGYAVV